MFRLWVDTCVRQRDDSDFGGNRSLCGGEEHFNREDAGWLMGPEGLMFRQRDDNL